MGELFFWIFVLGLIGLGIFLYFKFFKLYKIKNIVFIDGALGTGKSFLSISMAVRLYKKELRRWKFLKKVLPILGKVFPKMKEKESNLEKPILYSNIRLRNIEFTKLTKELLFRQKRFAYRSVLLIDEFSLMADQYCYKDREMSERLSLFFKLFRHETRGGHIVINSQSTSDLHYSLKYVLSDYLYIHHTSIWPLVTSLKVQEMVYCADKDGGGIVNARNEDIEETCKVMLVFKKYFKYYDTYCYSIFTDDLPVYCNAEFNEKGSNIKDKNLVSFKTYRFLTEHLEKGEKEDA